MHRLVWAFNGRIYHIVGNLMLRLIYAYMFIWLNAFSLLATALQMKFRILINKKSLLFLEVLGIFLHFYFISNWNLCKRKVESLIRCCNNLLYGKKIQATCSIFHGNKTFQLLIKLRCWNMNTSLRYCFYHALNGIMTTNVSMINFMVSWAWKKVT